MALPKLPLHGACLCGSVQFIVTEPPLLTFACHCRDCQKLSASAFTLTTIVPSRGFACSGKLTRGGLGAPERSHFYCASCLNIIYSRIAGADDRINLRTSLLDEAASFAPSVELMTDEKLPWAEVPARHSYAKCPTSLAELWALMQGDARN